VKPILSLIYFIYAESKKKITYCLGNREHYFFILTSSRAAEIVQNDYLTSA
jgi:hypothetical protein